MSEITQLIQQITGTRNEDKVTLVQCTVDSVDIAKRTCRVTTITGGAPIEFDAQLMAGVADGVLAEPEIDSMVYVLLSKYSLPFVVQYSDIVSLSLLGGEFGGLVKVIELTKKINALENKVNDMIQAFAILTLPVSGTTAGPPTVPPVTGQLTITKRGDIENTNITHGDGSS